MTPGALTDEQIARFCEDGWLRLDPFFSEAEIAPLVAEIDGIVREKATTCVQQGQLPSEALGLGFEQQMTIVDAVDPEFVFEINRGCLSGPGIFAVMTAPRLLAVIESLLGPEIIASSGYRIRPKMPGFFHCVLPWHQDSAVFEPECDTHLVITAWIALADSTLEHGCLEVLTGAHRLGLQRHIHRRGQPNVEIAPESLPGAPRALVPVRRGGVILFTNLTPHRSHPNTTDRIRWSVDFRYQSALNAVTNFGAPAGVRMGCFPPEADILIRSRARPKETITRWEDFNELRRRHIPGPASDRWGLGKLRAPFDYEGSV